MPSSNQTSKRILEVSARIAGALLALDLLLMIWGINHWRAGLATGFATYVYMAVPSALFEGAYGPMMYELHQDIKAATTTRWERFYAYYYSFVLFLMVVLAGLTWIFWLPVLLARKRRS